MKQQILDYITLYGGGVSFAELDRNIPNFRGTKSLHDETKNIVFWENISEEAMNAVLELFNSQAIILRPTTVFVYAIDGQIPNLPVAKFMRPYKTPRWMPIAINLPKT